MTFLRCSDDHEYYSIMTLWFLDHNGTIEYPRLESLHGVMFDDKECNKFGKALVQLVKDGFVEEFPINYGNGCHTTGYKITESGEGLSEAYSILEKECDMPLLIRQYSKNKLREMQNKGESLPLEEIEDMVASILKEKISALA